MEKESKKIKIISGRAGVGKTEKLTELFIGSVNRHLKNDDEKLSFFIVPEQLAVDMERKILERDDCQGMIGSEVIGFNRLCHKIITEQAREEKKVLPSSGLAFLIAESGLKHSDEFVYFKNLHKKPAIISKLCNTINTVLKYRIPQEVLNHAAENADNDNQKQKLYEISVIAEDVRQNSGEHYIDSENVATWAAELIMSDTSIISGADIFVDGFTDFTENEIVLLKAMTKVCGSMTIGCFFSKEKALLFSTPNKYSEILKSKLSETGIQIEEEHLEQEKGAVRFSKAPMLSYIEKNWQKAVNFSYSGENTENIRIFRSKNFYHELKKCAVEINRLRDEGYNFSDIGIIAPNIDENAGVATALFSAMGIPLFVDERKDLSGQPQIRYIFSALEVLSNNMSAGAVLSMLKTGLFKSYEYSQSDVDKLENLVLKHGVNNASGWKRMVDKLEKEEIPGKTVKFAEDVYNYFFDDNTGLCKKAKSIKSVDDCLTFISEFAKKSGFQNTLEHNAENIEDIEFKNARDSYLRVWNAFTEIVSECSKVIGTKKINGYKKTLEFTANALSAAIASVQVGFIPTTSNIVQIGNLERSKFIDKKVIFIINANEGLLPGKCIEDSVFGDNETRLITDAGGRMPYDSMESALFDEFLIYSAMCTPSEKLIVGYSDSDEKGGTLFPSACVKKLRKMFSCIKEETDDVADDISMLPQPSNTVQIDSEVSKKLNKIDDTFNTSVTALEKYAKCPYAYFLEKMLNLKERETGGINNLNIGNFFHSLLEHAVTTAKNEGLLGNVNEEAFGKLIDSAADNYFKENTDNFAFIREQSAYNDFAISRMLDYAKKQINQISDECGESGFYPEFEELEFGMLGEYNPNKISLPPVEIDCDGFSALVRGKIDRVDIKSDGSDEKIGLVDYKTGTNYELNENDISEGKSLQLITYYVALKNGFEKIRSEKGRKLLVQRLSYYLLGDDLSYDKTGFKSYYNSDVTEDLPNEKGNKSTTLDFEKLSDKVLDKEKEFSKSIAAGEMSIKNLDNNDCQYCAMKDICRKKL